MAFSRQLIFPPELIVSLAFKMKYRSHVGTNNMFDAIDIMNSRIDSIKSTWLESVTISIVTLLASFSRRLLNCVDVEALCSYPNGY